MTEPTLNFEYLQQAYDLITSHWKDGSGNVNTNLKAILDALITQVEALEIAAYDMIYQLTIDTAIGDQLDVIGEWVGESRDGLGDTEYRRYIKARIRINKSNGTPEELIQILSDLTQAEYVQLILMYPASYYVAYALLSGLTATQHARIGSRLLDATASGVEFSLVETIPTGYFGFAGDPNSLGFNDGRFAGVVYDA